MEHTHRCPGPRARKSCGAFLSKLDVDLHSLCSSCRGKVCSPSDTCPECAARSEVKWVKYRTKNKKSSKRSPGKASVSSPATLAGEVSGRVPSSSPTQSRGRGKSVKGKKSGLLPQESHVSGVSTVLKANQAPERMCSGGPRDVAPVQGERVSAGDPMWTKHVPFSSPDSWVDVSGASAAEGALDREDSPQEDPLGWSLPRTPGKSPMSGCFPFIDRSFTPPAPSTAVPEEFLQPSTSRTQQVLSKAPSVAGTRFHGRSESSAGESSASSDEERRRRRRRKRHRSRRRRSFSRSSSESRYRRRGSRSPRKKCRRAESPQERWVLVPESKLRDLSSVSGPVVRLTGDSPPRRASYSRKSASASDRKTSSGRHKSRSKETPVRVLNSIDAF
ncbi:serine/arginine repetitive matrix protein 1-like [Palaemon carinicauda]|uniref:serine/arginine repetitive matrix protein 1-like n=1 Tax=Palaemon carinicauda TaxID=392227 RepID=UPI0035B6A4D7